MALHDALYETAQTDSDMDGPSRQGGFPTLPSTSSHSKRKRRQLLIPSDQASESQLANDDDDDDDDDYNVFDEGQWTAVAAPKRQMGLFEQMRAPGGVDSPDTYSAQNSRGRRQRPRLRRTSVTRSSAPALTPAKTELGSSKSFKPPSTAYYDPRPSLSSVPDKEVEDDLEPAYIPPPAPPAYPVVPLDRMYLDQAEEFLQSYETRMESLDASALFQFMKKVAGMADLKMYEVISNWKTITQRRHRASMESTGLRTLAYALREVSESQNAAAQPSNLPRPLHDQVQTMLLENMSELTEFVARKQRRDHAFTYVMEAHRTEQLDAKIMPSPTYAGGVALALKYIGQTNTALMGMPVEAYLGDEGVSTSLAGIVALCIQINREPQNETKQRGRRLQVTRARLVKQCNEDLKYFLSVYPDGTGSLRFSITRHEELLNDTIEHRSPYGNTRITTSGYGGLPRSNINPNTYGNYALPYYV